MNLDVDAGLVDRSRSRQSYAGIGADTVVVFAVSDGNPKHIKGWPDLLKPGVQVVTPNPFSSGWAKWNILAAYGAQRALGKTDAQAANYVKRLFAHVVSQDTSGANATNTFLTGKGDVLITYESETINARLTGESIQYVIPRQTMLIELPIAVAKNSSSKDEAIAFIRFTKGVQAQELFAQYGFRPVNEQVAAEPSVKKEFPAPASSGSTREAIVNRLVHLGFDVRAELSRDDGERLQVQLSRDEAAELELAAGQIVYVQPIRQPRFSSDASSTP